MKIFPATNGIYCFILLLAHGIWYTPTAQCWAQTTTTMETTTNPLICDTAQGVCGLPTSNEVKSASPKTLKKPVKLVYFTDPICSSCWGIEPQLRKLKLEYGEEIDIEYRMGGLLPDWSYNSGGISKPSDVAVHWDEVSGHYDMPIDGDVWLEDPLHSSYPPSIAFKAAQMQDNTKALKFLRELREMVFLKKQNITKWEYIEAAAAAAGLNTTQLKTDYEGTAKQHFNDDLRLAKECHVRGFPTIFFINEKGQQELVYGASPYNLYVEKILALHSTANKHDYDKSWEALFTAYHTLTAREYSELSSTPRAHSEAALDALVAQGHLEKLPTKNGALWRKR